MKIVIDHQKDLPVRQPTHTFVNVHAIWKQPRDTVCDTTGRVIIAGGVEFITEITPQELALVCDPREFISSDRNRFRIVYDPGPQRGQKVVRHKAVPNVVPKQIRSMRDDIQNGREEQFDLVINLRHEITDWVYVGETKQLHVYHGVATRPDTNHRITALVDSYEAYKKGEFTNDRYRPDKPYAMTIKTKDEDGEGFYFARANATGIKASPSKALFVEAGTAGGSPETKLAGELVKRAAIFTPYTLETTAGNLIGAKTILFSTVTKAINTYFPQVDSTYNQDDLDHLVKFFNLLAKYFPQEYGPLGIQERRAMNETSIATKAVIWNALFAVARVLQDDPNWQRGFVALAGREWPGGFFDRSNPNWRRVGVIGTTGVISNRLTIKAAIDLMLAVIRNYQQLAAVAD